MALNMGKYDQLGAGIVLFIAFFSIGMVVIYGAAPLWQKQPFVGHFFANTPWTYFEFWNFVWWLLIVPMMIFLFLFYPASKVGAKSRKGFHR